MREIQPTNPSRGHSFIYVSGKGIVEAADFLAANPEYKNEVEAALAASASLEYIMPPVWRDVLSARRPLKTYVQVEGEKEAVQVSINTPVLEARLGHKQTIFHNCYAEDLGGGDWRYGGELQFTVSNMECAEAAISEMRSMLKLAFRALKMAEQGGIQGREAFDASVDALQPSFSSVTVGNRIFSDTEEFTPQYLQWFADVKKHLHPEDISDFGLPVPAESTNLEM